MMCIIPTLVYLHDYLQKQWYFNLNFLFVISALFILLFYFMVCTEFNWGSTSVTYVTTHRPNIPMITVNNPFTFEVNLQSASFRGVECSFSCSKDCYILPVWGVPIHHLFDLLNLTWMEMKSAIVIPTQDQFTSKCVTYNDLILLKAGENKTSNFRPPYGFDESQICDHQRIKRLRYPFAAIMFLQNEVDVQERIMVAMATVVHLADSWIDRPTHVIGQYLKPISGAVGILRKTYSSSSENVMVNGESADLCIICYHRAISVVILPCCHAYLCATCLELLENCPVCRGPAYSYFELYSSDRE